MYLEDFNLELMRVLLGHWRGRVVSLDIETRVVSREDFLTDEAVLGIALATRTSGELTSADGIEVEVLALEEESDRGEHMLLELLNDRLQQHRPLGVIGYGLRSYDIPLLAMKVQKYRSHGAQPLWKLVDLLQQAAHIDLYFMLRTWYGIKSLRDATQAKAFSALPLRRRKDLVSDDFRRKGNEIYRYWKEKSRNFVQYAEADVIDTLLIAEEILRTRLPSEGKHS